MRLRRKPWIDEAIQHYADQVFLEMPETAAGHWQEIFGRQAPLWVELGTGKGQFIRGLAEAHPEVNLVGLEVQRGVLFYAGRKVKEANLPHVRLVEFDIDKVELGFAPGEVDRFYLNFSDPWPKARHAKRRLTHRRFLARYQQLLKPDGEIHFKTDNHDLFFFSVDELKETGWHIIAYTEDLHADEPVDNVRTEYEEKFSAKGNPIYRLVAVRPEDGHETE